MRLSPNLPASSSPPAKKAPKIPPPPLFLPSGGECPTAFVPVPLPPFIQVTALLEGNGQARSKGKGRKKGRGRSKSAQSSGRADPNWRQQFEPDMLRLQINDGTLTGRPMHSPSPSLANNSKSNLTIAKRRYSTHRKDSLVDVATPEFSEVERRLRKSVPSSPQTVMALSGLFVCGLMLVLSGGIVLLTQMALLFRVAGLCLLLFGLLFLLICALLQRKNIGKWLSDMTRDLFALTSEAPAEQVGDTAAFGQVPGSFIRQ